MYCVINNQKEKNIMMKCDKNNNDQVRPPGGLGRTVYIAGSCHHSRNPELDCSR